MISLTGNQFHGDVTFMEVGDRSRPVVQLPEEAWQPIAEVDAPPGLDNLPVKPGAKFVGRAHELDRLDAVLSVPGQVVVQAVHGLGGIGKTTLVAHWAATRPHGHNPVRWITADTAAGVEQGLAKFAAALQPALAQALEVEQLADRALQWLATHSGWLLILDNVADPADIAEILARAGTGRIVITSRLASGWQPAAAVVRLDVLDAQEALALLTGILTASGPRDCDGAAELCAELGFLPLAIEQAGAYMAQNPLTTPRKYLQLLADYPAAVYSQVAVGADAERTVARVWRVTLDRITAAQPDAADLLRILAWYSSDAIPLALAHGLAVDPLTLDRALGVLTAYSMVISDPATATVSVHRLIQAIARTPDSSDPHRSSEEIDRAHRYAAASLLSALPDGRDPATWPAWRGLLPHIAVLAYYTPSDTAVTVRILDRTADFITDQGLTTLAITYLYRVVAHDEWALGRDHPNTLASRGSLAVAYTHAGRTDEAILLFEQTLADCERILGPDHPQTLTTRSNLAYAYNSAGRTTEAIPLYERTLTDSERILGPDHPDTMASRNNLASAYISVDRTTEAILLFEQALTGRERILGPDHPDTMASRNNLASAYASAGRTTEAIPLFERTLAGSERVLGGDDPDIALFHEHLTRLRILSRRSALPDGMGS
ncbi:FxSxx-COOH system tetratricopeptide repeat protein [Nocardia flavorosea]|uniref:Tetratricopeptide repeat protein n=1 Tax=Nocardia flavorosea TaxID=53429 RepID=A0A846YVA3_9NOCA|nr:FxSxx-COOH system tetratricopeptide repeat protein [Nocardia flavorosea]NKY60929.1 tetratricopeptide repeat protein [Nocardia flavorosea]